MKKFMSLMGAADDSPGGRGARVGYSLEGPASTAVISDGRGMSPGDHSFPEIVPASRRRDGR